MLIRQLRLKTTLFLAVEVLYCEFLLYLTPLGYDDYHN